MVAQLRNDVKPDGPVEKKRWPSAQGQTLKMGVSVALGLNWTKRVSYSCEDAGNCPTDLWS